MNTIDRDAVIALLADDSLAISFQTMGQYRSHIIRALKSQPAQPCERCAELEESLETERIRVAACGVVAMANTPESAAKARNMLPEYMSASCDDVARVVDSEMSLRAQLAAFEAENAWLAEERDEAVNAIQRLSEGQPFDAVVIADSIKRATAQHEQTIAQQAERIKELEGEIDKERQRRWDGNAESSRELAELTKQLAAAQKDAERYTNGWTHSCNVLTMEIELWVSRCPHCGKPAPIDAAIAAQKEGK